MSNDVLITPASRKIELKDSSGNVDAKIETDASGNLLITNAGGDISIGDTSADVFIGDGTNNVDIVFEQDGEIRGESGVTLTLGDSNTTLRTGTDLSLNSNDITNVANITTTDMSLSGTMTLTGAIDYTPDNGTLIKFDGQNILTRNTANGAITFGHDDAILITAGDTTTVMNSNINESVETIYLAAEGGFYAYAFPNNDTTWSNRKELSWNGSNFAVGGNNVISAAGAWVGSSSGLKGEPGAKGQKGEVGQKGQKGEVGQKGAPGAKGQKGEVGQKGATGAKGNTGQKGEVGQKGATGAKGNTGQKGAPGAKGQKGEVGQKGQKGQSHITGTVAGVSNSGWTTAFTVAGAGLGSQVRATFVGTANNVVVNTMADIIVNHSQDILVETKSGFYTLLSIRIISDNNEDFAVQLKTNHANAVTLNVEVFPLNNETITFTSSHSFTGATYTHDGAYGVKIGGGGGNSGDLRVGGDYYAGTTKVINANGTWAGSSSGLKGEPGVKGSTGQKGAPGAKGATGTATKGQKGEVGAKGATGTAVKGQKGEVGQKGAPGAKGQKGEQGASVKGQKGAAGAKGATGTATKGQKGEVGQKGEIGLTDAPYGAVPAYSNSNVNTINWNATEEAMMLESSSDTQIGAAFPAFRVNLASNETHKLSVKLKGSAASSSGIYIRVYEYNALLPSGKVAVSNSATYALVQEDTSGKTNWYENSAITTSWVTHEYTYTPTSGAQWASIVILNWTGFGTNTLYIRDPMWQLIGSSGAKGQKGAAGAKGQKGEVGQKGAPGAKGQKGEVGQKGQKGEQAGITAISNFANDNVLTSDSSTSINAESSLKFNTTHGLRATPAARFGAGGWSEDPEGFRTDWGFTGQGTNTSTWWKVCTVTQGSGLYSALNMTIELLSQASNFGPTVEIDTSHIVASFYRTGGTQDSPNNAVLLGNNTDDHELRIVKTATGTYELQIRMKNSYKDAILRCQVQSTNGGEVTWTTNDTTAGSTSGTVYTMTTPTDSTGHPKHLFPIVKASEIQLTDGLTVDGSQVINGSGAWVGSSSGLKGEPGAKGQKGEVGQKGQKGEVGQKGQKGEVGQKGQTGATGPNGGTSHYVNSGDSYSKFRLWGNDATYAIGMYSGQTHGALGDYAMTFQMNNDADRGFAFRHSGMSVSQAAMSLTTGGNMSVAGHVRAGYGISDTGGTGAGVKLDTYSQGTVPITVGRLVLGSNGKTGWGSGDELGSIDFYNNDGSGVGARNAARIVGENNTGNGSSTTTFEGELAFYTSEYNAQLNTDPALRLEGNNIARFYNDIRTPNGNAANPAYSFAADNDSGMFSLGSNAIAFSTGGTQRFKVNSNGLLLTGSSHLYVNGQRTITSGRSLENIVNITNTDGYIEYKRTGAAPAILDRLGTTGSSGTSNGEILNFKTVGTKRANIGYNVPYGTRFHIGFNTGGFGLQFYNFSSSMYIAPSTQDGANKDNLVDLGVSGSRFDDIYATNGTIQTSDRNEKQDIQALTDAETRVATACKGLIRRFRWVDSVQRKGDDARYHFGAIAQDVEDAFTAEGLNAGDYALFIKTHWWEHEGASYPTAEAAPSGAVEKIRRGIRYNQLLAFIISAL